MGDTSCEHCGQVACTWPETASKGRAWQAGDPAERWMVVPPRLFLFASRKDAKVACAGSEANTKGEAAADFGEGVEAYSIGEG